MDFYIFNLIHQFAGRWPLLDNLAIFFADKFGYILIVLVFVIFCLPAGRQGIRWRIIIQVFGAAILARLVITDIIRWILPRARPFVENNFNPLISQNPQESSFPSGHAAFYFAIAAVVYFYNKKLGILFFIAGLLMGLARVFSGVHWPSDIIVGAIVGILSAWLVIIFFQKKSPL